MKRKTRNIVTRTAVNADGSDRMMLSIMQMIKIEVRFEIFFPDLF